MNMYEVKEMQHFVLEGRDLCSICFNRNENNGNAYIDTVVRMGSDDTL